MVFAFSNCYGEPCEIDTRTFELRRRERPVAIEPMSFDLLVYLIAHRERVVLRAELLERLWNNRMVCEATVNHCVMVARKAVKDDGKQQRVIKTCHRRGYRFVAEVTTSPDSSRATPRQLHSSHCAP
ncbi:MAG TPA: winged helix-turn-helix domain-containing protein [Polyangiaceae bacterium]